LLQQQQHTLHLLPQLLRVSSLQTRVAKYMQINHF
jgi:hypothetical protein